MRHEEQGCFAFLYSLVTVFCGPRRWVSTVVVASTSAPAPCRSHVQQLSCRGAGSSSGVAPQCGSSMASGQSVGKRIALPRPVARRGIANHDSRDSSAFSTARWLHSLDAMNVQAILLCLAAALACGCESSHPQLRAEESLQHPAGDDVVVTFDRPVEGRATKQYWLAVARPSDADGQYVFRKHLARGATSSRLDRLPAGEYELRLHANYPVKEHDVVHRRTLRIVGEQPAGSGQ